MKRATLVLSALAAAIASAASALPAPPADGLALVPPTRSPSGRCASTA